MVGTSRKYWSWNTVLFLWRFLMALITVQATVTTMAEMPAAEPPNMMVRARARRSLASSAHACSSSRMLGSFEVLDCSSLGSHSAGKVTRASANSELPTPGEKYTISLPTNDTWPSSGPWPQARTFSMGVTVSPAGTGRCRVIVTFCDSSSQPSETYFQ